MFIVGLMRATCCEMSESHNIQSSLEFSNPPRSKKSNVSALTNDTVSIPFEMCFVTVIQREKSFPIH